MSRQVATTESSSDPSPASEHLSLRRRGPTVGNAEARLLFALARRHAAHTSSLHIADAMDWRQLLQLASDENALIALRDGLKAARHEAPPPEIERQLAILSLDRQFRMRRLKERLEQILIALNRAGIDVLLLKGSALAATVYGSFTVRSMRDIDLLVRPEQADRARSLMLELDWEIDPELPGDHSYGSHHHLPPLRDLTSGGLRLEIHRSVLPAGHPFRFTDDEVWRSASPARLGAGHAFVMQPVHHAVHVAIHFAWSHMMKLGAWNAFRDLDALISARLIDWTELESTAARWRASSCCYWSLRLGQGLSDLVVPHEVMRRLRPRLPRMIQRSLTRHFVNGLARTEPSCPSARLDQTLWNLAIQPRRQGHESVRPWRVSLDLLSALNNKSSGASEQASDSTLLQMRKSRRYISAILA